MKATHLITICILYVACLFLFGLAVERMPQDTGNVVHSVTTASYFRFICHQDSDILMEIDGRPVPLCPRCTGLHLGFFFAVLISLVIAPKSLRLANRSDQFFVAGCVGLMVAEWILAQLGLISSSINSRFLTGVVAGSASGLLILAYCLHTFRNVFPNGQVNSGLGSVAMVIFSTLAGITAMFILNWATLVLFLSVIVATNYLAIASVVGTRIFLLVMARFTHKSLNHEKQ